MKTTRLHDTNGLRTFLIVMDKGDEAFSALTQFAEQHEITAASMTAVGACSGATLGYFDSELSRYRSAEFHEQMELASCSGDIADNQGTPNLHAHIVLGRQDFSAVAGHLQKLYVYPTMEVMLTETPAHLRKRTDPETGLALIAPEVSISA